MITILGAAGRTGKRITETLLAAGVPVRAVGRSAKRLAGLQALGAEIRIGDSNDAGFLHHVFDGAAAAYTLLPYELQLDDYLAQQRAQGQALVEAARASGLGHLVFLSSVGADQPGGTGVLQSLHEQEQRLRTLTDTQVLVLRAGAFFENFHGALWTIKQQGLHADAVLPDLAIPMVASRDIADVAAQALLARDWSGWVVRELLGPRDLSHAEATRILGARIGLPELRYLQLPYDEMAAALAQAGFSACVAGLYVELARGINEGRVRALQGRSTEVPTPTRFEDFAEELAQTYSAL